MKINLSEHSKRVEECCKEIKKATRKGKEDIKYLLIPKPSLIKQKAKKYNLNVSLITSIMTAN